MHQSTRNFLNHVKNAPNLDMMEYFYTKLIGGLIDYLIELNPDISIHDVTYLNAQLERDNLKKYTGLDINSPSPSVRLAATFYGLCGILSSYLFVEERNESYLSKALGFRFFFPTQRNNLKEALSNFKNNKLITIYSELQKEVGPVNKSASRIK